MHAFIVTSFVARVLHFASAFITMHYHFLHAPIFFFISLIIIFLKSEIHLIIILNIAIKF